MKIQPIAGAVLTAALAACHAAAPPAANQSAAANAMTPDAFQQKIAGLPAPSRDGVLMRAITDAGYDCQKIEAAATHAPLQGHPAWTVTCDHDSHFVALIDANSYIQVVPGEVVPTPAASNATS